MPRRKEKDPNAFPTQQLLVLAICRFSEPIAFTSILAYTFLMVKDLGIEEHNAAFYAGLLVSAYAVAEALTSMAWGSLSDRVGRKPIVLSGLVGVALSSLIFGLAQQYWVALLARFLGGALNGNVSVMQTMVAEMVKRPEHEPRAYAVQPFVWVLGSIVGSAMGGFLARPAVNYPSVFAPDGLFGRYPYLLPNLVSVAAVTIAVIQGLIFLEETRCWDDDVKPRSSAGQAVQDEDTICETTPLRRDDQQPDRSLLSSRVPAGIVESSLPLPVDEHVVDMRRSSFGTVHSIKPAPSNPPPRPVTSEAAHVSQDQNPFNLTVNMLIVLLMIFSYHQMASQSLMPTHLLDDPAQPRGHLDLRGGLGYTAPDVGVYLSVNGVIGLFIQVFVFPPFVELVGVYKTLLLVVFLYPAGYILFPFLSAFEEPLISTVIYISLTISSFCGILIFPVTLILLKHATPSLSDLGKVNGLAMAGACLARTVAPPIAGIIYSVAGSGVAWFSCTAVAVLGIVQVFWVPRKHVHVDQVVVENPIRRQPTNEA